MYWTLHMANVGVLVASTLFSRGFLECASSPGLMSLRALRMWRPSSPSLQIPFLKNFTPKSYRYNGEKLQKGCQGEHVFFSETPSVAKSSELKSISHQQLPCIADERRSTGVWNEGWCKVGGITQRVLWMLKAWLSSSKGGEFFQPPKTNQLEDAAGAMCQLQQKIRSDYLSSLKTCAAKATV